MRFCCLGLFLPLLAIWPAGARAHLGLNTPQSRYGPEVLKTGPCGVAGGERSMNVTTYEPGETIEVSWDEYVDHPGHYRIAFDDDGDDDFVDPADILERNSSPTVLLDGITDKGQGERDYLVTVTLPDVSCDNCTLQVIQVMYDKPPYTTPGNDIYYQCADLVLRKGGALPDAGIDAGTDTGIDAGGGGCSAANRPLGEAGLLPIVVLLLLRRVARRQRLPI